MTTGGGGGGGNANNTILPNRKGRRRQRITTTTITSSTTKSRSNSNSSSNADLVRSALFLCILLMTIFLIRFHQQLFMIDSPHSSSFNSTTTTITSWSTNSYYTSELQVLGLFPISSTRQQQQQQQQHHHHHHTYCQYHDYHNFNYRYPIMKIDNNDDLFDNNNNRHDHDNNVLNLNQNQNHLRVGIVTTIAKRMLLTTKHIIYNGIQGSNYLTLVTICELETGLNCGSGNTTTTTTTTTMIDKDEEEDENEEEKEDNDERLLQLLPSSRNDIDLWIVDVVTIRKMGTKLFQNEILIDLIHQSSTSSTSSSSFKLPQPSQPPSPPRLLFLDYSDQVHLQPPGPAWYHKLGIYYSYNDTTSTNTNQTGTTNSTTGGRHPILEEEEENVPEDNDEEKEEGEANLDQEDEQEENDNSIESPPLLQQQPQTYIRMALSSVVQGRYYDKKTKQIHIGKLYNPDVIHLGGGPPLHSPYAVRLDIVQAIHDILPTVLHPMKKKLLVQVGMKEDDEDASFSMEGKQQDNDKEDQDNDDKEGEVKEETKGRMTHNRRQLRETKKNQKKAKQQQRQQRKEVPLSSSIDTFNPYRHLKLSPALDTVRSLDVIHFWDIHGSRNFNRHAGNYRDEVTRVINAMNGSTLLSPPSTTTTTTGITNTSSSSQYHILSTSTEFHGKSGSVGRRKANEDYITALLSTKIVVVAMRDLWEDHYRLLEAIVSGALVFTDTMLGLIQNMGFKHEQSIIVYNNTTQLQELIEYYIVHEQERLEIAQSGWEIALGRHCPWHRLEELLFGCPMTKVNQPYLI